MSKPKYFYRTEYSGHEVVACITDEKYIFAWYDFVEYGIFADISEINFDGIVTKEHILSMYKDRYEPSCKKTFDRVFEKVMIIKKKLSEVKKNFIYC